MLIGNFFQIPIQTVYGLSPSTSSIRKLYVWNRLPYTVENEICYTTLAFPDNTISVENLTKMHIKKSGVERIYQVEDYTVYSSNFVKWVGLYVNTSVLSANSLEYYDITFETSNPSFANYTLIENSYPYLTISCGLNATILYDKGLAWYSFKVQDQEQLLYSEYPNHINTIWEADTNNHTDAFSWDGSTYNEVAYDKHIEDACEISTIQTGALFNKVSWNVTDTYGSFHDGWIRVFKDKAYIEFWGNNSYVVNSTVHGATFSYWLWSDASTSKYQNSTLVFVKSQNDMVGITKLLFSRPTSYWGGTNEPIPSHTGHQDNLDASAGAGGCRLNYAFSRLNDTQPKLGFTKLGFGCVLIGKDDSEDSLDIKMDKYLKSPTVTYYCQDEEEKTVSDLHDLLNNLIVNYSYPYSTMTYISSDPCEQVRTRALRIIWGVADNTEIDSFINYLNNITASETEWLTDGGKKFVYANGLYSAFYVYLYLHEKGSSYTTRCVLVANQLSRMISELYNLHFNVESMQGVDTLNLASYIYTSILDAYTVIGGDQTRLLLNDLNNLHFCKLDKIQTNMYLKYDGLLAYNDYSADMTEKSTLNYIPCLFRIYGYYPSTTRDDYYNSLGYTENSIWWRLRGERDDFQWEFSHDEQDRLRWSDSFMGNLMPFIMLGQTSSEVKGTASMTLLYSYLENRANSSGFIAWSEGYDDASYIDPNRCVTSGYWFPSGAFDLAVAVLNWNYPATPQTSNTVPSSHGSSHSNTDMTEMTSELLGLGIVMILIGLLVKGRRE
jgi:hypothetical protein